jgi:hypothetical protein
MNIGDHKAYELFLYHEVNGKLDKDGKPKVKGWNLEGMLGLSTVKYFGTKKKDSFKALLALIQGGRAKNETPLTVGYKGAVGDIDLSSAYATVIRLLTYPVGIPTTWGNNVHNTKSGQITLGVWLKTFENRLVPRLWQVVVSGTLNTEQDLISSKMVEAVDIISKYNPKTCKIPAEFRLYLNEITNGVITSDILNVLKNVCSAQELVGFMDLKVQAAMFYDSNLRCNTAEEWYEKTQEHIEKTGGQVVETANKKTGETVVKDNRSKYWLAIPLSGFIDPYIQTRSTLKKEMKTYGKGTPEYQQLHAKQDAMKLVCNVCYGVLASPYFKVGEVCLANNITAIARSLVWLTAKGLGCWQTITDGGAHPLNEVRTWKDNKPSMDTMAKFRDERLLHRNIRARLGTKALGSESPWVVSEGTPGISEDGKEYPRTLVTNGTQRIEAAEGGFKFFDEAAMQHVRHYFRSEKFPIDLLDEVNGVKYEYKDVYVEYVGHSQTNYRLTRADQDNKVKARGHKTSGDKYETKDGEMVSSDIIKLFEVLSETPNAVPSFQHLRIEGILKCNQANEMLGDGKMKENVYNDNALVAGDSIYKNVHLRPLSLSMFHWRTDKQYQNWNKKHEQLKAEKNEEYGLERHFLDEDGKVKYQDVLETISSAICSSKTIW